MKPFFSEKNSKNEKINLVEGAKIISNDVEVAETFNNYFSDVVEILEIKGYHDEYSPNNNLSDIENIINKFRYHPSIGFTPEDYLTYYVYLNLI